MRIEFGVSFVGSTKKVSKIFSVSFSLSSCSSFSVWWWSESNVVTAGNLITVQIIQTGHASSDSPNLSERSLGGTAFKVEMLPRTMAWAQGRINSEFGTSSLPHTHRKVQRLTSKMKKLYFDSFLQMEISSWWLRTRYGAVMVRKAVYSAMLNWASPTEEIRQGVYLILRVWI